MANSKPNMKGPLSFFFEHARGSCVISLRERERVTRGTKAPPDPPLQRPSWLRVPEEKKHKSFAWLF